MKLLNMHDNWQSYCGTPINQFIAVRFILSSIPVDRYISGSEALLA